MYLFAIRGSAAHQMKMYDVFQASYDLLTEAKPAPSSWDGYEEDSSGEVDDYITGDELQ